MMGLHGPKCPKCTCSHHNVITEDTVECVNCGNRWQVLTKQQKAELEEFVKKVIDIAGWRKNG